MMLGALCVVILLYANAGSVFGEQQINQPSEFVNGKREVLLMPGSLTVFRAATCGEFDTSYEVHVKVELPKNPMMNPDAGLAMFAVSHDNITGNELPTNKTICKQADPNHYDRTCVGDMLEAGKDIYVYVKPNHKSYVYFDITVKFRQKQGKPRVVTNDMAVSFPLPDDSMRHDEDLKQIYIMDRTFYSPFLNKTLIHLTVCRDNSMVGKRYTVTSTFMATDTQGLSTISQVICDNPVCNFNSDNIGEDIFELPISIATSKSTSSSSVYVYAVSYGGPMSNEWPLGEFRFAATIQNV